MKKIIDKLKLNTKKNIEKILVFVKQKRNKDITQEIKSKKEISDVDINQPTEEFNTNVLKVESKNFDSPLEEVSHIVKTKVNKQNEKLSKNDKKYFDEKARLEAIKKEMIEKTSGKKEDGQPSYITSDSAEEKRKMLLNLGYISPTYSMNKDKEINYNSSKELDKKTVEVENNETHDKTIDKDFEESIISEIQNRNLNTTEEIPMIEDYSNELFDSKIDDTLREMTAETKIDFDSTAEVIIEDIEEYKKQESALSNETENNLEENESIPGNDIENDQIENNEEFQEYNQIDNELETMNEIHEDSLSDGYSVEPENWAEEYVLPNVDLLATVKKDIDISVYEDEANIKKEKLDELFKNFFVGAKVVEFKIGPTVTTFKVSIDAGTKITRVTNLEDNIKLDLGVKDVRIQAPIPGESLIGIEVPNTIKIPVSFKEVYEETKDIKTDNSLILTMGKDVFGKPMHFDLAKAPHLLVAGSTGSGKSVSINTILASLILRYKPDELKLVLVDPKMVEFTPYHGIPHLMARVIINASDANSALKSIVNEMEERYKLMAQKEARNLEELNSINVLNNDKKLPYIVVVIDELADLMMVAAKEVEDSIRRITQKARAAGIHMILATQRPSTDVITGVIKSNIPSRIAFTVASSIDSRTILDAPGANKLIGMGDMLVSLYGKTPVRGQGAYISIEEIKDLTSFIKQQEKPVYTISIEESEIIPGLGSPTYDQNDPLYISAKKMVIQQQKASTSLLQRYLSIGYNKAANLMDSLESNGVIGPSNGSKPREILKGENDD